MKILKIKAALVFTLAAFLSLLPAKAALPTAYTVVDMSQWLPYGSSALAINTSGAVVGRSLDAVGTSHAFKWQNGTVTVYTNAPGVQGVATAVSDDGSVVIWSGPTGPEGACTACFIVDPFGNTTPLPVIGSEFVPYGISPDGNWVTGWYKGGSTYFAFKWRRGDTSVTPLLSPGGGYSIGYSIDNDGNVVGDGAGLATHWDTNNVPVSIPGTRAARALNRFGSIAGITIEPNGGGNRAFIAKTNGGYAMIGLVDGTSYGDGLGLGINDADIVVGSSTFNMSGPSTRAFIYSMTEGLFDLNNRVPGQWQGKLATANGINADGWIVVNQIPGEPLFNTNAGGLILIPGAGTINPGNLEILSVGQLRVTGEVGATYTIQSTDTMSTPTGWSNLVTLTLTNSSQIVPDPSGTSLNRRFYRLVQIQ